MLLEEMMNDKFKAGKAAGIEEGKKQGIQEGKKQGLQEGKKEGEIETRKTTILDILALKGSVSDNLKQKVSPIEDIETAQKLYQYALTASSCTEFEQELDKMNI